MPQVSPTIPLHDISSPDVDLVAQLRAGEDPRRAAASRAGEPPAPVEAVMAVLSPVPPRRYENGLMPRRASHSGSEHPRHKGTRAGASADFSWG